MIDYKKIISNRELRLKMIKCLNFIPTKLYLKMVYWIKTGKKLNLKNPVTLCDKLNWLKIHEQRPEYTQLVDKVAVRDYVFEKVGQDICFPLLGVWEHYDDIDFTTLPEKFVLKCNHDSGSVKIICDKSKMNHVELKNFFESRLKMNPYTIGREYPYRDVKPRVFAEKFMIPNGEEDINDFKFFCFNGEPKFLFVATERNTDCKFDFFDMNFNHMDIQNIHPNSTIVINKPEKFEEMKELAVKLSEGMKFVRIDLYEIKGEIYFGEFTFFHAGGFWPLQPEKYELEYGELISTSN